MDFHLLLASNVSKDAFPENRPDHFYTRLQHPLTFEQDVKWCVALKEITFHNSLLSIVDEGIEVWDSYSLPQIIEEYEEYLDQNVRFYSPQYIFVDRKQDGMYVVTLNSRDLYDLLTRYGRIFLTMDNGKEKQEHELKNHEEARDFHMQSTSPITVKLYTKVPGLRITVHPRSRNYSTVESLCKEIQRILSPYDITFRIVEEDVEKYFQLYEKPDDIQLVLIHGMHYVLGFDEERLERDRLRAKYKPDLRRGAMGMMIYCNLCQYTLVGDAYVPLLRFTHLPTHVESGAVVNHVFNPPIYVPVDRIGAVHTLEIDLRTDSGREFRLSPDGKVFLTLHFQKSL